jgi:hypothetical protein
MKHALKSTGSGYGKRASEMRQIVHPFNPDHYLSDNDDY